MPTVPTYLSKVQSKSAPNVQRSSAAPDGAFGDYSGLAKVGQAMQQVGETGLNIATDILSRRNKAAADEAYTQVVRSTNTFLNDPENGQYKKRIGKDSAGFSQDTETFFRDQLQGVGKDLPEQYQIALNQRLDRYYETTMGNVSRYEVAQVGKYEDQVYSARLETTISDAASNYTSMASVSGARSEGLQAIIEHGAQRKWSKEQTDLEKEKFLTNMHVGVIGNLMEQNPDTAKKYFEANREEINGTVHDKLTKALEDKTRTEEVDRFVSGVQGQEFSAQLKAAKQIKDRETRNAALTELTRQHNVNEKIKTEQQYKVYESMWNKKQDGSLSVSEVRNSNLEPSQKEHLLSGLEGSGKTTDEQRRMRKTAIEVNRLVFSENIDAGKYDTVMDLKAELVKASLEDKIEPSDIPGLVAQWKKMESNPVNSQAYGVLKSKFSSELKDDENRAQFDHRLRQWAEDYEQVNKRPPSYEEIIKMGDGLMKSEGSWFWKSYQYEKDNAYYDVNRPADLPENAQWNDDNGVYLWQESGETFVMTPQGKKYKAVKENGN